VDDVCYQVGAPHVLDVVLVSLLLGAALTIALLLIKSRVAASPRPAQTQTAQCSSAPPVFTAGGKGRAGEHGPRESALAQR